MRSWKNCPPTCALASVTISLLIEEFGLERVREPHVKHVRGSLWEMRMKGKDGISRALYVTAVGQRVVVVRVFVKKTEKTPNREIELALKRAKEVLNDKSKRPSSEMDEEQ
jgi:phage-related protein